MRVTTSGENNNPAQSNITQTKRRSREKHDRYTHSRGTFAKSLAHYVSYNTGFLFVICIKDHDPPLSLPIIYLEADWIEKNVALTVVCF